MLCAWPSVRGRSGFVLGEGTEACADADSAPTVQPCSCPDAPGVGGRETGGGGVRGTGTSCPLSVGGLPLFRSSRRRLGAGASVQS